MAGETRQQVIDIREASLGQVAALDALARDHAKALARIEARLGELVASSQSTGTARAVVLAYHRVAEPTTDPFELAVSPDQFQAHLEVLSTLGHILSVGELSDRIENGTLPEVSFALTFDDGYADNLHAAKPILERNGAPATVFVATGCLGGKPFWWDELAQLMANDGAPGKELKLELDGASRSWQLEETELREVCCDILELLRPLDDAARQEALAVLRSQLGSRPVDGGRSLTSSEISELIEGGLVDVGAHTRTHPLLSSLDAEAAHEEVVESKAWLEACLERRVISFAYPYGDYGARELEIVRRAGFEIAFSTIEEAVTIGCDRLQMPRIPVGHWEAEDLERTMSGLVGTSRANLAPRPPEPGEVDFADLRRVEPIGRYWGIDRGHPIDRHYMERFLERRAGAIRGRVLEFEEPRYTTMFGGDAVTQSDVLDVGGGPGVTYSCRLEEGHELPAGGFDCIICTQVFQYIYDVRGALRTLHRVLKPGGCLLLTVPGITPIRDGDEWGDHWHWTFTEASISRLCSEAFGKDSLEIEVFGNVLAATGFLHGLADSELTPEELGHVDPDYTVIIGAQVVKQPGT
jgi:peptidoglycan/xylan/chitin deacetylase (PgdA/CDA1 family)/SAM-dependent methyltransferase